MDQSEEVNKLILEFCSKWNQTQETKFKIDQSGIDIKIPLDHKYLAKEINVFFKQIGIKKRTTGYFNYDEDDYLNADFIGCEGATVDETSNSPNYEIEPDELCTKCERRILFSGRLLKPYMLNEDVAFVDDISGKSPIEQWDILQVVNANLLVSYRVKELLLKHNFSGYYLGDVIAKKSGKVSELFFQLFSNLLVPADCNIHTDRDQGESCQQCGMGLSGGLLSELHFKSTQINGADIFAHNYKSHGGRLKFSNRLYKTLLNNKIEGLNPYDINTICKH